MNKLILAVLLVSTVAHAGLIQGNIELRTTEDRFRLTVWQDEERTNPTALIGRVEGTKVIAVSFYLDEGSDWFLTSPEDTFGERTIDDFDVLKLGMEKDEIDVGFEDFYLGVNSRYGGQPIYGWAHLVVDNGNLKLLDSAVSYEDTAVIVGTMIPEPTSIALIGIAGGALILIRRWRS